VATIPILVLFVLLAGLRVAAHWASLITLTVALVIAVLVYGMPIGLAVWVLFVLAFVTFVGAAIFAGGGGGVLEVSLYTLVGVAFIAVALYLRSKSTG
jgi:L-lactate permease